MEKADDHNRPDIRKAKCLKQSVDLGTQFAFTSLWLG